MTGTTAAGPGFPAGGEEDDEQTVADRIALPGQLLLPGMPGPGTITRRQD